MRTQLGKDEKVILLVKKHWITLTKPFFLIFIFIGVIIAAFKYPALASFKDVGLALDNAYQAVFSNFHFHRSDYCRLQVPGSGEFQGRGPGRDFNGHRLFLLQIF